MDLPESATDDEIVGYACRKLYGMRSTLRRKSAFTLRDDDDALDEHADGAADALEQLIEQRSIAEVVQAFEHERVDDIWRPRPPRLGRRRAARGAACPSRSGGASRAGWASPREQRLAPCGRLIRSGWSTSKKSRRSRPGSRSPRRPLPGRTGEPRRDRRRAPGAADRAGAAVAAAMGAEPARISATALRKNTPPRRPRRPGRHRHGPDRRDRHPISRDITRHPLRFVTAWAARTALPPVHHQESPDPQKPPRRPGRDPAASAPAARHRARPRSRTRRQQPDTRPRHPGPAPPRRGSPACPRCRKRPQEHGLPRTGASAGPLARTRLTKSNRNSSRTAPTRPVAGYKT